MSDLNQLSIQQLSDLRAWVRDGTIASLSPAVQADLLSVLIEQRREKERKSAGGESWWVGEPDWDCFQRAYPDDPRIDEFMFMGFYDSRYGTLRGFKHINWRGYVFVDEDGNTFLHAPGRPETYVPATPEDAYHEASGNPAMDAPTTPGFPVEPEPWTKRGSSGREEGRVLTRREDPVLEEFRRMIDKKDDLPF